MNLELIVCIVFALITGLSVGIAYESKRSAKKQERILMKWNHELHRTIEELNYNEDDDDGEDDPELRPLLPLEPSRHN